MRARSSGVIFSFIRASTWFIFFVEDQVLARISRVNPCGYFRA